jgi:hypothetical protein
MTHAPPTLPNLTPLADVALLLRIPYRRLYDRALARQFSHIRIGKERYLTDPQLEALLDAFTEEKEEKDAPQSDRDKAIQETRDRLRRQQGRRRTPRQRSAAA